VGRWIVIFAMFVAGAALPIYLATLETSDPHYQHNFQDDNGVALEGKPIYRFGIFPLHNPMELASVFEPLTSLVNSSNLKFTVKFETSRDFSDFEGKVARGEYDFAIVNSYQAQEGRKSGYVPLALLRSKAPFSSIFLARKEMRLENPLDLNGKKISLVTPSSLGGSMMARLWLKKHGVDIGREMYTEYVNSFDSAVLSVFSRLTDVAVTTPLHYSALLRRKPEVGDALEAKWETPGLPGLVLVARADLPKASVEALRRLLTVLREKGEGAAVFSGMGITGFAPAGATALAPVRRFLSEYAAHFGGLPSQSMRLPDVPR
jgi:phosphonate transport system substrate-binding protein